MASTFVFSGSATAEPSAGTAPEGHVAGSSQRFKPAPRCGQFVRGFASGVADICGMNAAPMAFMV